MENNDLFNVIISDKLTWEGLIRDIVRDEGMDPWNIDIINLSKRFVKEINKNKEINLRVSGKFILAASILLKMKSDHLLNNNKEKTEEDMISLAWLFKNINYDIEPEELIPRIPMKKKRKVTLEELIDALRKAIEVKERRIKRRKEKEESNIIPIKMNRVDLGKKITEIYDSLTNFFKKLKKKEVKFEELLPSHERFDMTWTFVPLLHLTSRGEITMSQEKTFGDIYIKKPGGFIK